MGKDDPLVAYGRCLHQDVDIGVATPMELASATLSFLSRTEREALREYLVVTLNQLTASELKGRLNRASENWRFTSNEADRFLRATLEQLQNTG